jgi:hypothetical protein
MGRIWRQNTELEKQAGYFARPMFSFVIMREAEYYGKIFGVGICSVVLTYVVFHKKERQ